MGEENSEYDFGANGKLRALIVDDDKQVSTFLQRFFDRRDNGTETVCANDSYAAERLLRTFCPHVVLLDLVMPGTDGFEFCRQIKKEPGSKLPRVIAMTGYYSQQNVSKALTAGADCCIEKPLDLDLLDTLVAQSQPRQPRR